MKMNLKANLAKSHRAPNVGTFSNWSSAALMANTVKPKSKPVKVKATSTSLARTSAHCAMHTGTIPLSTTSSKMKTTSKNKEALLQRSDSRVDKEEIGSLAGHSRTVRPERQRYHHEKYTQREERYRAQESPRKCSPPRTAGWFLNPRPDKRSECVYEAPSHSRSPNRSTTPASLPAKAQSNLEPETAEEKVEESLPISSETNVLPTGRIPRTGQKAKNFRQRNMEDLTRMRAANRRAVVKAGSAPRTRIHGHLPPNRYNPSKKFPEKTNVLPTGRIPRTGQEAKNFLQRNMEDLTRMRAANRRAVVKAGSAPRTRIHGHLPPNRYNPSKKFPEKKCDDSPLLQPCNKQVAISKSESKGSDSLNVRRALPKETEEQVVSKGGEGFNGTLKKNRHLGNEVPSTVSVERP